LTLNKNFRKGIQMAHLGNCTALSQEDDCPVSCGEEQEQKGAVLVCGSDGNVYKYADYTIFRGPLLKFN